MTGNAPMIMKIIKALWIGATLFVLFVTLYSYDGKPVSDIWVFLTWLMLILSFPVGLVVSAVHYILGAGFSIAIKTSYLSLALEWGAYFGLGYLQWFKLVPYLIDRLCGLKTHQRVSDEDQVIK
jgi:hypothetical protein